MEDEQVGEMIEKEVDVEKDVDVADKPEKNGEKNRPRSATKLEKDRQNRLCRDQKKAERAKEAPEEVKPDNEVIEEKAEVEGMETKKKAEVETRKIRKDSEGSSSQWETESDVVEGEEGKWEVSREDQHLDEKKEEEKENEKKEKDEKNDKKETREETKRLAAKIRSAGRRNRRKSSKGSRQNGIFYHLKDLCFSPY